MRRRTTKKLGFDNLETRRLLHGGAFGGAFGGGFARDGEMPTIGERVDGIFERVDADANGEIVADEVSERMWNRLSEADVDESGGISTTELVDYKTAQLERRVASIVDRVFKSYDANEDSLLTQDEVSQRRWERLSGADANEDSAVSGEEMTTHLRVRFGLTEAEAE